MPIYEYRCQDGHHFDIRQGFSDDPVAECQVCGAPVQRVFRPIAVHFKGSGFYNTDYGTRKRSRELKEHKEATKSESSSGDGSSASASPSASPSASKESGGSPGSDSSGAKSDSGQGTKQSERSSKARAAD